MTGLDSLLRQRIRDGGPIPLSEYLQAALLHPQFGYYHRPITAETEPFGRSGDYITAPEINQMFGELIAAWCIAVWELMRSPDHVLLAELGPGRGTLLADVWRCALGICPSFARAISVHLIESNPVLIARQRAVLSALSPPPSQLAWFSDIREALDADPHAPLLLVANEFLDALPIDQYVRDADGWRERRVGLDASGEQLAFVTGPLLAPGSDLHMPDFASTPQGSIFECSAESEALMQTLTVRIAAQGGAALLIDYGPTQSGCGDTLQALRGHRPVDPLAFPGDADVSHHVDFGRLRTIAERAGARAYGPVAQGLFLCRLGIAARAEALIAAAPTPDVAEAIIGGARRLVHPGRMGVLFKALAVTHAGLPPPPGFVSALG